MSFSDTIFLFFLALIIFGPKKLPEIARHAGKLLAELRRASNEFKSQIETEIAHLEVQQRAEKSEAEKNVAAITSGTPPQGTVASLSLNPAGEPVPQNASATLAAPIAGSTSSALPPSAEAGIVSENSTAPAETVAVVNDPESQASHV